VFNIGEVIKKYSIVIRIIFTNSFIVWRCRMAWTEDRVEKLKTMWTDGNSASQIAKALGDVTRNVK
jgi:hypothetical protein